MLNEDMENNCIPGNGFCFYTTMLYFMKSAQKKEEELPAAKETWEFREIMNELLLQLEMDIEFWQKRLDNVLPVLSTSIYIDDVSDMLKKIKAAHEALQKIIVEEKNTNGNCRRDLNCTLLLQNMYWGGNELGTFLFMERCGYPLLGFQPSSLCDEEKKAIKVAYLINRGLEPVISNDEGDDLCGRICKQFVMLRGCNSKDVVSNRDINKVIPYYETSAIRDYYFTYYALMDMFDLKIPAFVCKNNHNYPINIDYKASKEFLNNSVEKVAADIFEFLFGKFVCAMQSGASKLFSRELYLRYNRNDSWKNMNLLGKELSQSGNERSVLDFEDHSKVKKDNSSRVGATISTPQTIVSPIANSISVYGKDVIEQIYADAAKAIDATSVTKPYESLQDMLNHFLKLMSRIVGGMVQEEREKKSNEDNEGEETQKY